MTVDFGHVNSLGNTPGIWYALSYFMATLVFLSSNRKKTKGINRFFGIALPGGAIIALMALTNGISGFGFFAVMVSIIFLIMLSFYINTDGGKEKDIYYGLRAFMLGEFMASLGWQIYYYFDLQFGWKNDKIHQVVVMLCVIALISVLGFFMEKKHSAENRDMEFDTQRILGAAVIVGLLYFFSNLSYVVSGTPFTTIYSAEFFMIRTSSDLMGVMLLYFYHELLQQTAAKIEEQTLRNMLEMQYTQYQVSEESMALVNQKYHDLKHQIAMLRASILEGGNQENTEYLDMMLDEIRQYEAQYKTGNRVLDTMLSTEAMKCQAKDIELTCVCDGEALSFMKPMDISALFGNALDNAIESAEQIEDKGERLIHLSVDRQRGFLRINVENRFAGNRQFRHHLPLTTKSDKNLHGYGVKSMKQIAEKYGGSIRAEAKDGWFNLSILIPIPVHE